MSASIRVLLNRFYDLANGAEGSLSEVLIDDFDMGIAHGFPYGGDYLGMEDVGGFFANYKSHFDSWRVDIERFIEVDDQNMIATGSYTAVASDTGKEFNMETAHIWTAKDGMLTSLKQYCDTAILSAAMDHKVPLKS
jgi:uncharacterized protein